MAPKGHVSKSCLKNQCGEVIWKKKIKQTKSAGPILEKHLSVWYCLQASYPSSDGTTRFLFAAPPGGRALSPASGPQRAWQEPPGKTCCG